MHQFRVVLPRLLVMLVLAAAIASCSDESGNLPPEGPDFSASEVRLFIGPRTLLFEWDEVDGATEYKLFENPDGASGFSQIGPTIPVDGFPAALDVEFDAGVYTAALDIAVHLQDWENARYRVESCSADDICTLIGEQGASGLSAVAVRYVKTTTSGGSFFGTSLALSEDGTTLVGGAIGGSTIAFYKGVDPAEACDEDGNPVILIPRVDEMGDPVLDEDEVPIIDIFDEEDNLLDPETILDQCPISPGSGTVFAFDLNAEEFGIDAFIKAPNADDFDRFGEALAVNDAGNLLVVSATGEDSNSIDTRGNDDAESAGAAYVFSRGEDGSWPLPGDQADYLKASNAEAEDFFGSDVAISGDGTWIAVSAIAEASATTGVNGDEENNDAENAGAVYLFRSFYGNWSQEAYIKASNTDAGDFFGESVALNQTGDVLVVGAPGESSADSSDESDNSKTASGAVYVFTRVGSDWTQQALIKASNANDAQHGGDILGDGFGSSVSLTDDGLMLLVGAPGEDSISTGVDGNLADNSFRNSGAAYLFVRDGDVWNQQTYFKASNTGQIDEFGRTVELSSSGNSLVIAAQRESSSSTGINGTENIDNIVGSGAAYYFEKEMSGWRQRSFVKASVRGFGLQFGWQLALAQDGKILAASTPFEDGIGNDSGAVFVY